MHAHTMGTLHTRTCLRIPADEVTAHTAQLPDLLFSVDGALGVKGALSISCSPEPSPNCVAVPPDAT